MIKPIYMLLSRCSLRATAHFVILTKDLKNQTLATQKVKWSILWVSPLFPTHIQKVEKLKLTFSLQAHNVPAIYLIQI